MFKFIVALVGLAAVVSAETGELRGNADAQLVTAEQLPLAATRKPTAAEEMQVALVQDTLREFGLEDPYVQLEFVMAMNKAHGFNQTEDVLCRNPSLQCRACQAAIGQIISKLAGTSCAAGCVASKVLAPFAKVCKSVCATIAKGVTNTEWICSQGFWDVVGGPPCP